MALNISAECKEVLALLARSKNVLISGPPGTGKSRLLSEVALAFEAVHGTPSAGAPTLNPRGGVPIPPSAGGMPTDGPAPSKSERKVFRTVFHQNSKYRDFVSGIVPSVVRKSGDPDFTIVSGILYRASEHAKRNNGAALLVIDEINRGPAVQVFGGAIVAMEADKRLAPDGSKGAQTQFFELMKPPNGEIVEYALPSDLYILAAMNQADASVEPLDVAFLRRWEPYRLEPSERALRAHYKLSVRDGSPLPTTPAASRDALEASARALIEINKQITLGRGREFQVGHGVLFSDRDLSALPLSEVLQLLCVGWAKVRAHVEEVFFGDVRATAAVLNALDPPTHNPFQIASTLFGDDPRFTIQGPDNFSPENIYAALRAFARE